MFGRLKPQERQDKILEILRNAYPKGLGSYAIAKELDPHNPLRYGTLYLPLSRLRDDGKVTRGVDDSVKPPQPFYTAVPPTASTVDAFGKTFRFEPPVEVPKYADLNDLSLARLATIAWYGTEYPRGSGDQVLEEAGLPDLFEGDCQGDPNKIADALTTMYKQDSDEVLFPETPRPKYIVTIDPQDLAA